MTETATNVELRILEGLRIDTPSICTVVLDHIPALRRPVIEYWKLRGGIPDSPLQEKLVQYDSGPETPVQQSLCWNWLNGDCSSQRLQTIMQNSPFNREEATRRLLLRNFQRNPTEINAKEVDTVMEWAVPNFREEAILLILERMEKGVSNYSIIAKALMWTDRPVIRMSLADHCIPIFQSMLDSQEPAQREAGRLGILWTAHWARREASDTDDVLPQCDADDDTLIECTKMLWP